VSALARRLPPWSITAVFGLVYVTAAPRSPDLATASYRSHLFSAEGLSLWDNAWYGGHHLPAYSLLAPALGSLAGPRLLAAVSMTLAAALFAAVIEGRFPKRATSIAAPWFALGAAVGLLSSRVAFDLGLALGLAAVLAAQRRRPWLALALTLLTSLASPVAGAFLALALIAWTLAGPEHRWPAALTVAALAPIGILVLVFPEGGTQPFAQSAFYPALAGVLLIAALVPTEQRALRIGVLLYAIAMVGAFLVPTAVGGNADRLGALVAAPLAACLLAGAAPRSRRGMLLLGLAPLLTYWQANAPVADFAAAASDPSVSASYYRPLLVELRSLGVGYGGDHGTHPARIEVVPSAVHWEARWVAPKVMIARGWERQVDGYRDRLFYSESEPLTPARYRAWLTDQAVSYIALPDSPLDYSATAEARLLRGQPPTGRAGATGAPPAFLAEVWHSRHWRLFAVRGAAPLAQAPAVLRSVGHDSFTLLAPRAGTFTVRVHFTPYWALASGSGCIARAPGDWTQVQTREAESLRVVIRFSLARVFDHGARCA
jgi:ABC-type amino acid transport system permease subunit